MFSFVNHTECLMSCCTLSITYYQLHLLCHLKKQNVPLMLSITYLGFWWKQGPAEAVHVAQVHLDAGVGEPQLMKAGGVVAGTDITLTRERRDGDGVLQLRLRQVVADPAIHVTLKTKKQAKRQT